MFVKLAQVKSGSIVKVISTVAVSPGSIGPASIVVAFAPLSAQSASFNINHVGV